MASSRSPRLLGWLDPEVVLGIATVPILAGLVSAQQMTRAIVQAGVWSEELFRGDRLPMLDYGADQSAKSNFSKSEINSSHPKTL